MRGFLCKRKRMGNKDKPPSLDGLSALPSSSEDDQPPPLSRSRSASAVELRPRITRTHSTGPPGMPVRPPKLVSPVQVESPQMAAIMAEIRDLRNSSPRYKDMLYLQNRADEQVRTATTAVNRAGQVSERVARAVQKLEELVELFSHPPAPDAACSSTESPRHVEYRTLRLEKMVGEVLNAVKLAEAASSASCKQIARLDEKIAIMLTAQQDMMGLPDEVRMLRHELAEARGQVQQMSDTLAAIERAASAPGNESQ